MKARSTEKVSVTGGAGFIGSHLVNALITQGTKVCVLDNLTSGTLQNIKPRLNNPNLTFIKGDLLNPTDLKTKTQPLRTHLPLSSKPRSQNRIHKTNKTYLNPNRRA